jgi:hypothetical protein
VRSKLVRRPPPPGKPPRSFADLTEAECDSLREALIGRIWVK